MPTRRKPVQNSASKLKPIPPEESAARDEGPRLIPLDDHSKEPSRLEHYLELADTALGLKRPER
ncbi:MAG TPA: hypothetical protein VL156_17955 [Terriglobales bacterium]|jgi:hypothetical protein|nr:hypothetical protein [Terriglobales bacterium]